MPVNKTSQILLQRTKGVFTRCGRKHGSLVTTTQILFSPLSYASGISYSCLSPTSLFILLNQPSSTLDALPSSLITFIYFFDLPWNFLNITGTVNQIDTGSLVIYGRYTLKNTEKDLYEKT